MTLLCFLIVNDMKYQTLQIHGGLHRDETLARGIAIHPTAAYEFRDCAHGAALFDLSAPGNIYTRIQNPTVAAYEERVAALYGGVGALAVSSGMASIMITVTQLCEAGDNVVVSPVLYGGTHELFHISLSKLGIEARTPASLDPEDWAPLVDERTRLLFVESMGNPTCVVADIEALARVAHEAGVPLVVDNTFGCAGYLCNPIEWGADIICDSATKWMNGHGTTMSGVIVDAGRFDWGNGKYPRIDGPSEGYHGLNMWEAFGPSAFIVKCRVDGLRDFGCSPSPFDAYLMLLGLETLSLRVKHQVESTRRLAEWCQTQPKVKQVSYVGLEGTHPSYAMAQKYFRYGGGGVLNVELVGDLDSTVRFVESLKLFAHMVMIGDSRSVITHPASTTHRQLSDDALAAAGVTPTLLRVSPGLEDIEDIIADFEQALQTL